MQACFNNNYKYHLSDFYPLPGIPETYNSHRRQAYDIIEIVFKEYLLTYPSFRPENWELKDFILNHLIDQDDLGKKICSVASRILQWNYQKLREIIKKEKNSKLKKIFKKTQLITYAYLAKGHNIELIPKLIFQAAGCKVKKNQSSLLGSNEKYFFK